MEDMILFHKGKTGKEKNYEIKAKKHCQKPKSIGL